MIEINKKSVILDILGESLWLKLYFRIRSRYWMLEKPFGSDGNLYLDFNKSDRAGINDFFREIYLTIYYSDIHNVVNDSRKCMTVHLSIFNKIYKLTKKEYEQYEESVFVQELIS